MDNRHLTSEQLTTIRDGETGDPTTLAHLVSCPACQRKLDDMRWTAALARPAEPDDAPEHPADEEIAAFRENALGSERARRVQRHLGGCDRCLALFGRLREADRAAGYSSPEAGFVERVKQRLARGPGLLELGRLVLTRAGKRLDLTLQPLPATADRAPRLRTSGGMVRPRVRARQHAEDDAARGDAFFSADGAQEPEASSSAAAKWFRPSRRGAPPPAVSEIDAGPFHVRVEARQGKGHVVIAVKVRDAKSSRPCAKLRLRVEYAGGKRRHAETDRTGRARLTLPAGASRLTVDSDPPLRLELDNRA